jgi:lysyl-tRNA synthetase class 2
LPQDVPAILMDYPAEAASLARLKPGDPTVGERFELYAGGLELANGFSELNDPLEQRARFLEANDKRLRSGLPPLPLPEPFLADLGDMPPAAGIALGIDRLVMLCADADRIDDVIAFTPEEL